MHYHHLPINACENDQTVADTSLILEISASSSPENAWLVLNITRSLACKAQTSAFGTFDGVRVVLILPGMVFAGARPLSADFRIKRPDDYYSWQDLQIGTELQACHCFVCCLICLK